MDVVFPEYIGSNMGLAGRLKMTGAKYGMNVFLRGNFWGLRPDG